MNSPNPNPNPNQPSDTWSNYIASTYAASISPTTDPDQYAPNAQVVSPTTMSSASPTSGSANSPKAVQPYAALSPSYGPYSKSGRGGAGNFTWQNYPTATANSPTHTNPHASLDRDTEGGFELQEQSSLTERQRRAAEVELREQADAIAARRERDGDSGYVSMGRGGAGNYAPSSSSAAAATTDLESQNPIQTSSSSTITTSPTSLQLNPPPSANRTGYFGRGGAGNFRPNYVVSAEAAGKQKEDAQRRSAKEEEVRRNVEARVLAEIGRPQGVVVREGRNRG